MNSALFQHLVPIVSGGITLFLPGYALLAWLPHPDLDFAQQAARAMGLSMSLTALGALVTFLTGWRLNSIGMITIYAMLAVLGMAGWLRHRIRFREDLKFWAGAGLTAFLGMGILVWRIYQARDLVLPAWVDSLHHVLIVQAILDRGGLPANLEPILPVPLFYHYGFHVVAAVYSFWSRLPADMAVLVMGQILMAGMSLAVYRLASVVWKKKGKKRAALRGAVAALLVALVSTMPGYYLSWGRYTLLAGLILLSLAMAEILEVCGAREEPGVDEPGWNFSQVRAGVFVMALLVSGVLLTHYLVAIILALFLILQGMKYIWMDFRRRRINFQNWLPLLIGVSTGTLLVLPWLVWVISFSSSLFTVKTLLPSQPGLQGYASYLWNLAGPRQNYLLLLLGVLGLLLAFIRPPRRIFAVWSTILIFLCLPIGIQLGPLRPDIMVMMIFLPAVVLAGHLLVSSTEAIQKVSKRTWLAAGSLALAMLLLCAWGIKQTTNILNPVTILVQPDDKQALDWINQNVPGDARFYINTTPWQGSTYRGVDGGWWILPLTGRQVLLPPVIYVWGEPEYVQQVNEWAIQASQISSCSTDFWQLVKSSGVNYIYLHSGEGALQPSAMENCSGVQTIYQVGGVFIYKITSTP